MGRGRVVGHMWVVLATIASAASTGYSSAARGTGVDEQPVFLPRKTVAASERRRAVLAAAISRTRRLRHLLPDNYSRQPDMCRGVMESWPVLSCSGHRARPVSDARWPALQVGAPFFM